MTSNRVCIAGCTISIVMIATNATIAKASETFQAVPFQVGDVYFVSSTERLSGFLETEDPFEKKRARKKFPYLGSRSTRYAERILPIGTQGDPDLPDRVFRVVETLDSQRRFGSDQTDRGFPLRDQVKKRIVLHRGESVSKPYSLDGPLKIEEVYALSHLVFVPALNGLLPQGELKQGTTWNANRRSLSQLAGLLEFESGDLKCQVKNLNFTHNDIVLVQIVFQGFVAGMTEEGRVRDEVDGSLYLARDSGKIHSLTVQGTRSFFDESAKKCGELELEYKLAVRFRPSIDGLSDQDIQDVPITPSRRQTALLYENPAGAVSFVHPRVWFLREGTGTRLLFTDGDPKESNQLIVNLHKEGETPTVEPYAKQVDQDLRDQKYQNIEWVEKPKEAAEGTKGGNDFRYAGRFEVRATKDGVPWTMKYFVAMIKNRGISIGLFIRSNDPHGKDLLKDPAGIIETLKFTSDVNPLFAKPPEKKSVK